MASTALGISADKIYTMETSTTTVPNTSPTAASCGSDLNGAAVLVSFSTLIPIPLILIPSILIPLILIPLILLHHTVYG